MNCYAADWRRKWHPQHNVVMARVCDVQPPTALPYKSGDTLHCPIGTTQTRFSTTILQRRRVQDMTTSPDDTPSLAAISTSAFGVRYQDGRYYFNSPHLSTWNVQLWLNERFPNESESPRNVGFNFDIKVSSTRAEPDLMNY